MSCWLDCNSKRSVEYLTADRRQVTGSVRLTSHEWETGKRLKDDYWLYVVETAFDKPTIHTFQNPYERYKNKVKVEEVIDYRYIIEDWK